MVNLEESLTQPGKYAVVALAPNTEASKTSRRGAVTVLSPLYSSYKKMPQNFRNISSPVTSVKL